jgi:hypothetical protein
MPEINIKQERWTHETFNARKSLKPQENRRLGDHYGLYHTHWAKKSLQKGKRNDEYKEGKQ